MGLYPIRREASWLNPKEGESGSVSSWGRDEAAPERVVSLSGSTQGQEGGGVEVAVQSESHARGSGAGDKTP